MLRLPEFCIPHAINITFKQDFGIAVDIPSKLDA
jgi:hypothetical protein